MDQVSDQLLYDSCFCKGKLGQQFPYLSTKTLSPEDREIITRAWTNGRKIFEDSINKARNRIYRDSSICI